LAVPQRRLQLGRPAMRFHRWTHQWLTPARWPAVRQRQTDMDWKQYRFHCSPLPFWFFYMTANGLVYRLVRMIRSFSPTNLEKNI
jgi:hypothetical protein